MRLTIPPVVKRLTTREYLPMAGWLGTWAMLGIALGHADTVRLLAAHTLLQAIRALCALEMTHSIALRIGAPKGVRTATRRRALRIELFVLLACLIVGALLVAALYGRGAVELAWMLPALALGLPARHPGVVFIAERQHDVSWRVGIALASLAGAAVTLFAGLEWWWAAVLFGLRDWGGLLLSLAVARPRPQLPDFATEPLRFEEVAARTEFASRRRITYRLAKTVLGAVLGPFGSVVARTGRGFRLDGKLSRLVPRHRGGMMAFTVLTAVGAAGLLAVTVEPFFLLLAASVARLSASGASALLWWKHGDMGGVDDDTDDD